MTSKKLRKKRIASFLITAGPTREKIDPIRFISNYSTGTFGYELASEAKKRAYRTTLISGPTHLVAPAGVKVLRVESALEMFSAVKKEIGRHDCLIMAAAVSDWRVRVTAKNKIKKDFHERTLRLVKNPDILAETSKKSDAIMVGFALETENVKENALKKLKAKDLDIIVANAHKGVKGAFGSTVNPIIIIDKYNNIMQIGGKTKKELAKIILDKIEAFNI